MKMCEAPKRHHIPSWDRVIVYNPSLTHTDKATPLSLGVFSLGRSFP